MFKNLISQIAFAACITISSILGGLGGSTVKNYKVDTIKYVCQDIVIENSNQEGDPKIDNESNLNLTGINSDTLHRIYMSSDGDKNLPDHGSDKVDDYKIGKGSKNTWYKHLIHGLSFDVTKYANDKTDFLSKYKAITFSYFYQYNFWNTWYEWTYEYGKSSPLMTDVKTYQLSANNTEWLIFDQSDASHSQNERANLVIKQEWSGNTLSYNFYLGVCYYWKAGSNVKHASLASLKGDEYTFTRVPENKSNGAVNVDELYKTKSTFSINQYQEQIDLAGFDSEIKRKAIEINNSKFKKTSILIQGYFGSIKVNNNVYIFSLLIRWINLPNEDSNLLLNGLDLSRIMLTNYKNKNFNLLYENSTNNKQESSALELPKEYFGMQMQGNFFLPFIYN